MFLFDNLNMRAESSAETQRKSNLYLAQRTLPNAVLGL